MPFTRVPKTVLKQSPTYYNGALFQCSQYKVIRDCNVSSSDLIPERLLSIYDGKAELRLFLAACGSNSTDYFGAVTFF